MKNEEGTYLYKTNCEECGSSDANAVYSSDTTHCFSCGFTRRLNEGEVMEPIPTQKEFKPTYLEYPPVIREIRQDTLKKFSYGFNKNLDKHVAYMYNTKGEIVAEKYRGRDKVFSWSGNSKQACLFGQTLWKPNKKISITVTEGELDAMSISQMQNNKYPVVSITSGADKAYKEVKKQLEWLLGFKEVVLCFDNDKAGQAATDKVASLFPPKFVRIASLPLKDANDMIKNNRSFELANALRDAKYYTPDGILQGQEVIDQLRNEEEVISYLFPDFLANTNKMLGGIRTSELMVFTAGTGSGKTTMLKQLQYHYFKNSNLNQALIHLEEPLKRTAKDLVGISMDVRLHLNDTVKSEEYLSKAEEIFLATDSEGNARINLYDSFGSMDSEDLYNKIRFMVKGLDCKVIWLDHLSILVSGLGQAGDERRAIDSIMHELKSLTVELDCFIGLVVHLNNNTQTPFEEGGSITINNLRGSGGIKQLSDSVIAISRNQQAETECERNTVKVSVLKNRYSGETGVSDEVYYNGFTGKFEEHLEEEGSLDIVGGF